MKGARAILEILKEYEVKHVFGLPGETSIPLYLEWINFPEIKHILTRDERNACFMADGYAKVSYKPGICEAPSVGATHLIPGVIEAYKSSTPMVVITTDTPLNVEKRNMLTGFDQTPLFQPITKDSITIYKASDIPFAFRRAFRLATTGKPGPTHLRIPIDVLEEDVPHTNLKAQREFSRYPGHRFCANLKEIERAVNLLIESQKPVIICGQGALYSAAWDEIEELAEFLGIPVGTTISGKGSFSESHPLSIGVVGIRGGTPLSNEVIESADLIFYIGCNTDFVTTNNWKLPEPDSDKKIIHLDISEVEVSNNYSTDVILIGDAKSSLKEMLKVLKKKLISPYDYLNLPRTKAIIESFKKYKEELKEKAIQENTSKGLNPLSVIEILNETLNEDYVITVDPGTSAIYSSAFFKAKKAGRKMLFNFSLGALGYALPAAIGAYFANPGSQIFVLTGDGSLGFTLGELETISRENINIKIILFRNDSFGWIKATMKLIYGSKHFSTEFKEIEYYKVAQDFGIDSYKVENYKDLKLIIEKTLGEEKPAFIEIPVPSEDELVPPVPSWLERAKKTGLPHIV